MKYSIVNTTLMFQNYLKTAWRNILNNKGFSAINILGLSIGIASFILISLYVVHELSYDKYHENGKRIYRIVEDLKTDNEQLFQSVSSPPMGPALQREFPEVESFVRFNENSYLIRKGDQRINEDECFLADSNVFKVFSWPLVKGDPNTALAKPYSIVVTTSTARKYFGNDEPVGKVLEMNDQNYTVTGVVEDTPENSHFHFNMLVSFATFASQNKEAVNTAWFWNGFHTYLLLNDGPDVAKNLSAKIPAFIEKNIGKKSKDTKMWYTNLPLQPLTKIYLATPRSWENGKRGSESNLYVLSIIAIFILLIACFNYINLATARASRRVKEVSLRKVLGAERQALIKQFLGESIIVCSIAMVIGLIVTALILPKFGILVEAPLTLGMWQPKFWIATVVLTLLVGVLSGAYPALIASGFHPLQMFRKSGSVFSHQWLRKMLVSVQFVISITLIAGTILVFHQLKMMRNLNLGFEKERTLVINYSGAAIINDHLEAVKQDLRSLPEIASVNASSFAVGSSTNNLFSGMEIKEGEMSNSNINVISVDRDFLPDFGIKLLAGRNFSPAFPADDTTAFILNEAAVKSFGLTPEKAIGRKFEQNGKNGTIVGVMQDFHYRSLHHKVEPLVAHIMPRWYWNLSLKINSKDMPATVAAVERKWKSLAPDLPFQYSFLDQDYNRLYTAEANLSRIVSIFSGLAIFIASLGLIGLTSFAVERRFKEIGIRKVLGASAGGVIVLISEEFMKLIAISFLIAVPLTIYMMRLWLKNFTNQISIDVMSFVIAGASVLIVSWIVIGYLSFRAAISNPVNSLRVE